MTPDYSFDPMEAQKVMPNPNDPYYRPQGLYYAHPAQQQQQQQQLNVPVSHHQQQHPLHQQQQQQGPSQYYSMPLPMQPQDGLLMENPYQVINQEMQPDPSYAVDLVTPITPHPAPMSSAQSSSSTTATNASLASVTKGKKKYPCPHAARFACTDTFTTSGHAARHGKKHTGEKNIHCPTCNKAFTRKDNMKQHERTHKNRDSISGPPPAKKRSDSIAASQASLADGNAEPEFEPMDTEDSGVGRATRPPMRRSGLTDVLLNFPPSDLSIDTSMASRPELDRKFSGGSLDGEGESPGLDALAMAASGLTG
jgi:hypothetical protein